MVQYLLLKSDGESDDADLGLTSDTTSNGGVLGGDTYSASHITNVTTASGVFSSKQSQESVSAVATAARIILNSISNESVISTSSIINAEKQSTIGTGQTSTPLLDIVVSVSRTLANTTPLTPTLSISVLLGKTGVGIEGSFADSFAATVGAETTIKLPKKVVTSETFGASSSQATPSILKTLSEIVTINSVVSTETVLSAIVQDIVSDTFAQSSTESNSVVGRGLFDGNGITISPKTTAVSNGAVMDVIAFEFDTASNTHSTAEILSQAAQTLVDEGVVETATTGAAVVATTVSNVLQSANNSTTSSDAVRSIFSPITVLQNSSSTVTPSINSTGVGSNTFGTSHSELVPDLKRTLVSTINTTGQGDSATTANGLVTDIQLFAVEALYILYQSLTGTNEAVVLTEQQTNISDSENEVVVLN